MFTSEQEAAILVTLAKMPAAPAQPTIQSLREDHLDNKSRIDIVSGWNAFVKTPIGYGFCLMVLAALGWATSYFTGLLPPSASTKTAIEKAVLDKPATPQQLPPIIINLDGKALVPKATEPPKEKAVRAPTADEQWRAELIERQQYNDALRFVKDNGLASLVGMVGNLGAPDLVACCGNQPTEPLVRGRGYNHPSDEKRAKMHADAFHRHGHRQHYIVRAMTAPATFDSRTMGWISPIRDQGNCGDCFGVEASDALTIAFIKAGYQKADGSFVISEQAGLDCGYYHGGCNGGDGPQVYSVMKSTGFPAEKYVDDAGKTINDYPAYTGSPKSCRTAPGAKRWKCADFGYVTSDQSDRAPTVNEVKAGIMAYGTVTFAFDASALNSYNGAPITRLGRNIDHEITGFIGWDDSKACPDGSKGAFICRNQWGKGFGDGGYFWLAYSAVPGVVEACFITATPLPPPPPPPSPVPVPPGPAPPSPTPIGSVKLTIAGTLPPGTYEVLPVGVTAVIQQLQSLLGTLPKASETPKPTADPRLDALEKDVGDLKASQKEIKSSIDRWGETLDRIDKNLQKPKPVVSTPDPPLAQKPPPPAKTASITVLVPVDDAKVFFNSSPTNKTGTRRQYVTELEDDRVYVYEVAATYDGNKYTRSVVVRRGASVTVDFTPAVNHSYVPALRMYAGVPK